MQRFPEAVSANLRRLSQSHLDGRLPTPPDALGNRVKMARQLRHLKNQSLLELPLEIRLRIYEFVFTDSKIYVLLIGTNPDGRYLHIHGADVGILLTCRQIYHEARSEWYAAKLWTVGFPPTLGFFLRSTSAQALARVRHLTMQIHELPDLNTKLVPGLKLLVIDFSTDLPSFLMGSWQYLDDEKIYSQFADEAIARVHSTFKVLITELHEESRTFNIALFASIFASRCEDKNHFQWQTRYELFVNLDTKAVQRRTIDLSKADEHEPCPKEKLPELTYEASESEHSPQRSPRLPPRKFKFPPGREGPFRDEDKDERGSIRSFEQEDSSDDEDEDEDNKRMREGVVWRTDWEDVKRIIEHLGEDEQSASGAELDGEVLKKFLEAEGVRAEVDDQGEQSVSSNEAADEDQNGERLSDSGHVKAERGGQIQDLIFGEPEQALEPQPKQEQAPTPLSTSQEQPPPSVAQVFLPATQLHVAGDQHRRVEERVIYTSRCPEPPPPPPP